MNAKGIVTHLLGLAARFVDTDGDGRVEISDIPGALAKAASLRASGLALIRSGEATLEAIRAAAQADSLTSGGVPVTAADVEAAWVRAKVPFSTAADEARAELAKG
ncbi:MAG: hypothetical protein NUW22_04880 [Acidobacteria bacterium]|nr:hypothetical protein [Acidobacteriota bacterium]